VTFQELITNLSDFWIKQGCILAQPYDVEVGAGTMNPILSLEYWGQSLAGSLCGTIQTPCRWPLWGKPE